MRRLFPRSAGAGGKSRSFLPLRGGARANGSAPADLGDGLPFPRTLQVGIEAATFVPRHDDDQGERIAVFCNELGGSFLYDRAEAAGRVCRKFPGLSADGVAAAVRYLENHLAAHMRERRRQAAPDQGWLNGWRSDGSWFSS